MELFPFSDEPTKEEGSDSHKHSAAGMTVEQARIFSKSWQCLLSNYKQNAAGMNSWKNKNIFKSMPMPFIELY